MVHGYSATYCCARSICFVTVFVRFCIWFVSAVWREIDVVCDRASRLCIWFVNVARRIVRDCGSWLCMWFVNAVRRIVWDRYIRFETVCTCVYMVRECSATDCEIDVLRDWCSLLRVYVFRGCGSWLSIYTVRECSAMDCSARSTWFVTRTARSKSKTKPWLLTLCVHALPSRMWRCVRVRVSVGVRVCVRVCVCVCVCVCVFYSYTDLMVHIHEETTNKPVLSCILFI